MPKPPPCAVHPVARAATALGMGGFLVAVLSLPPSWQQAAALRRDDVLAGEVWRLWTGHFVHFGLAHALFDAAALAVLLWCALGWLPLARLAWAGLGAAPLLSIGVLGMEPSLREYRGASGLVVALLTWTGMHLWRRQAADRHGLLLGAVLLVGKLVWDAGPGRAAGSAVLPPGVSVAWSMHLAGALLGALLGAVPGRVRTAQGR